MFGRLLPKEVSFFAFFNQHAALTLECAKALRTLADGIPVTEVSRRISALEHEADGITHRCVAELHKTFITPLERDDIHGLASGLDDIADLMDDTARRMTLYEIEVVPPVVTKFADLLVASTSIIVEAVSLLHDMKNAEKILEACKELNRLENEADNLHAQAIATLFKEEKDPIAVLKWTSIYDALENATDACEEVAHILEGVVLEHA